MLTTPRLSCSEAEVLCPGIAISETYKHHGCKYRTVCYDVTSARCDRRPVSLESMDRRAVFARILNRGHSSENEDYSKVYLIPYSPCHSNLCSNNDPWCSYMRAKYKSEIKTTISRALRRQPRLTQDYYQSAGRSACCVAVAATVTDFIPCNLVFGLGRVSGIECHTWKIGRAHV